MNKVRISLDIIEQNMQFVQASYPPSNFGTNTTLATATKYSDVFLSILTLSVPQFRHISTTRPLSSLGVGR